MYNDKSLGVGLILCPFRPITVPGVGFSCGAILNPIGKQLVTLLISVPLWQHRACFARAVIIVVHKVCSQVRLMPAFLLQWYAQHLPALQKLAGQDETSRSAPAYMLYDSSMWYLQHLQGFTVAFWRETHKIDNSLQCSGLSGTKLVSNSKSNPFLALGFLVPCGVQQGHCCLNIGQHYFNSLFSPLKKGNNIK